MLFGLEALAAVPNFRYATRSILIERYVFGIRRGFFISYLFIMSFPFIGLAQVIDCARMESTKNQILDRVRFFLPL